MKILLIHNYYIYRGGEDVYFDSLVKLLHENGYEVIIYTKNSRNIKTFLDKIRVSIGMFWNKEVENELDKLIKLRRPDVAHIHNLYPLISLTAARICKKNNLPIVQTIHNYRFMCPKGIVFRDGSKCELCVHKIFPFYSIFYGCYHSSRLASLFFSLSFFLHKLIGSISMIDKYIFPSEFTKKYYEKHLRLSKSKAKILPYFIDIKTLPRKTKEEKYLLYVGRFSEEKGIIQLLNVVKKLPSVKLKVLGNGPLYSEVQKYKRYSNIEVFSFLERRKVFEYIRNSAGVIIPSLWYEVLPNVYIESVVLNVPLLVSNNENFRTFAKYSSDIQFFNPKKNGDLRKKILHLYSIKNKNRRVINLKENNRYSPDLHIKGLLKVYKESLSVT